MRIHIVGGGAIGLLFAARLTLGGAEAVVWTRTKEQCEQLRQHGLMLFSADEAEQSRVVRMGSEWLGGLADEPGTESEPDDGYACILLAVKQTDIDNGLLDGLKRLVARAGDRTTVVCLQNGVGHLEKLAAALGGSVPLYAAVTTEGAKRENAVSVRHTGIGQIWISERAESGMDKGGEKHEEAQKMFVNLLNKAGFKAFLSNDISNRVYRKLLVNAVINPLTAMYDVANGELPAHPHRLAVMKKLHRETAAILNISGIELPDDSWDEVLDVCKRTSGNISSMLSDVRSGKRTEIDAINGAIVALGKRYGIAAPYNEAVMTIINAFRN